jgi:hypothetical protein
MRGTCAPSLLLFPDTVYPRDIDNAPSAWRETRYAVYSQ